MVDAGPFPAGRRRPAIGARVRPAGRLVTRQAETPVEEPRPDALWAAWLTLDDPQRHAMDATFQDITALSGLAGA